MATRNYLEHLIAFERREKERRQCSMPTGKLCPMKKEMLENINMYWDGQIDFNIPLAGSSKNALFIFKKNIAAITWNCISTLEKNPATLPQTETILNGQSVTGISIDDLMQVKRFGDGAKKLMAMVSDGSFNLDEKTACILHNEVGKEEALTWGKFRDSSVTIRNVDQYNPPESNLLNVIAKNGFSYLQTSIDSPSEKAVAVFLFMARSQFFHDANKRTASLLMNGSLLKDGVYPIIVMNRNSEEFHTKLTEFYNTGNATDMMHFFARSAREMYPHDQIKSQNQMKTEQDNKTDKIERGNNGSHGLSR